MRAPCAVVIVFALLGGMTGPVAAQMNREDIPATFVTGTMIDDTERQAGGEAVYEQTVEWSDPRLPPTLRADATLWKYGDKDAALERLAAGASAADAFEGVVNVAEMRVLLEGDEGSWRGSGRSIEWSAEVDPGRRYSYYVLEGDGAYEGMHALLRGAPGHDANRPWDEEYEGWIVEGELPLPPEPPSDD